MCGNAFAAQDRVISAIVECHRYRSGVFSVLRERGREIAGGIEGSEEEKVMLNVATGCQVKVPMLGRVPDLGILVVLTFKCGYLNFHICMHILGIHVYLMSSSVMLEI